MQDRQPTYPGRVKLTPVSGQANVYDMERADQPIVEGTALNKANLLPDDVCDALNIPITSNPKDAFLALNNAISQAISGGFKVGFGSYVGTGEKARTLTFDYAPKMVSIFAYLYTNGVFVTSTYLQFFTQEWYDTISYISQNGSDNGKITNCSWDSTGKEFTFQDNTSSTGQDFNRSGYTYYFFYIY